MRKIRHIASLLLLLVLLPLSARADQIRERLYVQTDKRSYLSGEQVLLKLITTDQSGRPIDFSKIGYVELLDQSGVKAQSMVMINQSVGIGSLSLPESLKSGYYRLRGYTAYMRNEGETVFFQTILTIVNTTQSHQVILDEDASLPAMTLTPAQNTCPRLSLGKDRLSKREAATLHISGLPKDVFTMSLSIKGEELPSLEADGGILSWGKNLENLESLPMSSDYTAEYEGHIVQGTLKDTKTMEPVQTGVRTYLGLIGEKINVYVGQQQPSDLSKVRFYTKGDPQTTEAATTVRTLGNADLRVDVDNPYAPAGEQQALPELRLSKGWTPFLEKRNVARQISKAYPAPAMTKHPAASILERVKPTESYLLDEYTRFTTIGETVFEFVTLVSFRGTKNDHSLWILLQDESNLNTTIASPLVVLDGIPVEDVELIYNYNPMFIKRIDVYRERISLSGQMFEGAIAFTTYTGNYPSLTLPKSTQIFDYKMPRLWDGIQEPDYAKSQDSPAPDYRHTLAWRPQISTQGKDAIEIDFSTSDLTGHYTAHVEGITVEGEPFLSEVTFEVE